MVIYKYFWTAWPWRWGHHASFKFLWLFTGWYGFWFQHTWILNIRFFYLFLPVVIPSVPDNGQIYYKNFKAVAYLIIVTWKDWVMQLSRYACVCLYTKFSLPRSSGPLFLCYWNINVHYKCKFYSDILHSTDIWKGERWCVVLQILPICLNVT